jgi:hypothetical protein
MTYGRFKYKYRKLIERGVIKFSPEHPYFGLIKDVMYVDINEIKCEILDKTFSHDYIIINRMGDDNKTILAKKCQLFSPERDVIKLGYHKLQNTNVFMKMPEFN